MKDLEIIKQENKKADDKANFIKVGLQTRKQKYKHDVEMILRYNNTNEEKINQLIGLIDDILSEA